MAWTQANFNTYMQHVRGANPHYERYKKSRIHAVTGLLKTKRFQNNPAHLQSINTAWQQVPDAARQLYDAAWQYVSQTLFPPVVAPSGSGSAIRRPAGAIGLVGLTSPSSPAVRAAVTRDARVMARDHVVDTPVSQHHNGTAYTWPVRFRLRFVRGGRQGQSVAVIVTIAAFSGNSVRHQREVSSGAISAIPATHRGAALNDTVKRNWKSRITERWSSAVFVVQDVSGDDLETYDIDFDFNWVDNAVGASQIVYAVQTTDASSPPDGTINTMYWGVDDGGNTGAAISHEFGHLIGNPDEYGTCTFNGMNNTRDRTSVMDNETTGQSKAGHYWLIGQEIATALGIDPARCLIRLGTVNYRVAAGHPWR